MGTAFYTWKRYKKSTLVEETDLIMLASKMPIKQTLKTRLRKITYWDMKAAILKTFGNDYSYSCHGDMFEISRHKENSYAGTK